MILTGEKNFLKSDGQQDKEMLCKKKIKEKK